MSKIVLVADSTVDLGSLSSIRRITNVGLDDLKSRIAAGRPFWEGILFENDHDEQARILRALSESAEKLGVSLKVFELEPEEAFDDCDKEQCEIDISTMNNILKEAELRGQ